MSRMCLSGAGGKVCDAPFPGVMKQASWHVLVFVASRDRTVGASAKISLKVSTFRFCTPMSVNLATRRHASSAPNTTSSTPNASLFRYARSCLVVPHASRACATSMTSVRPSVCDDDRLQFLDVCQLIDKARDVARIFTVGEGGLSH